MPDEAALAEVAGIVEVEQSLERDEQEEWEYEYSTTETEVQLDTWDTLAVRNYLTVARLII
jgi:hypothetical protein